MIFNLIFNFKKVYFNLKIIIYQLTIFHLNQLTIFHLYKLALIKNKINNMGCRRCDRLGRSCNGFFWAPWNLINPFDNDKAIRKCACGHHANDHY